MSDVYRNAVQNAWPPERLITALEELADAEKATSHDVTCKSCRQTYSYKLPGADGPTRLKALQLISDIGYGKPAPTKTPADDKPIAQDIDPTKLTSQQRQALIAQLRARLQQGSEPNLSPAA